jgi:hypothetical protein
MAQSTALLATRRALTASSAVERVAWARVACWLSPGNFLAMNAYATALMAHAPRRARAFVEQELRQFPFIPLVIARAAAIRIGDGDVEGGKKLLLHALANDPDDLQAKALLERVQREK